MAACAESSNKVNTFKGAGSKPGRVSGVKHKPNEAAESVLDFYVTTQTKNMDIKRQYEKQF